MKTTPRKLLCLLPLAALMTACQTTVIENPNQPAFPNPAVGFKTMVSALKSGDVTEVESILGLGMKEILTGDPVSDRRDRESILKYAAKGTTAREVTDSAAWIDCGPEKWTFPVPLLKQSDGSWRFDGAWGREEIRNRIMVRNEVSTLNTLRDLVAAQEKYHGMDPDKDGVKSYAERIFSTPGQRNGLFWLPAPGAPKSPVAHMAAAAKAEGYEGLASGKVPFHGYHFMVLHSQGGKAPGGARSYVDANGKLTGGFAFIAWPADYGRSGAMTFLASSSDRRIYEKDLGKATAAKAARISVFNPDDSWLAVDHTNGAYWLGGEQPGI